MTTDVLTKGSQLAERLRSYRSKVTQEMDALAAALDGAEAAVPVVFDRAHAFMAATLSEVADLNGAVQVIGNAFMAATPPTPRDAVPLSPQGSAPVLDMKSAPGIDALPSGVPANVAAALNQGG